MQYWVGTSVCVKQQVSALEMEWGKTADIDQSNKKELSLFFILFYFLSGFIWTPYSTYQHKKKEENNNFFPSPAAKSPFKSIKYQHIFALFCKNKNIVLL